MEEILPAAGKRNQATMNADPSVFPKQTPDSGPQESPEILVIPASATTVFINRVMKSSALPLILLTVLIAVGIIIAREIRKPLEIRTRAGSNTARISVQPKTATVPPASAFQIWVTADNPVASLSVRVLFDPDALELTRDASVETAPLTKSVAVTPVSEANRTGSIGITMEHDPAGTSSPPSGTFRLAVLTFAPKQAGSDGASAIRIDPSTVRILSPDRSVFTVSTVDSSVTVNPASTPSATPLLQTSPAPTVQQSTDTVPPEVTIIAPGNGSTLGDRGTVRIEASARDESGIEGILILLDDTAVKTCPSQTCQVNYPLENLSSGTHTITVRATDASTDGNYAERSITVRK